MSLTEKAPEPGTVEAAIVMWINTEPNINQSKATDGGYEGWAQLQFYSFLKHIAPGAEVMREQHIFLNTSQKVDIFIKNPDGSRTAIELKLRTKSETRQDF